MKQAAFLVNEATHKELIRQSRPSELGTMEMLGIPFGHAIFVDDGVGENRMLRGSNFEIARIMRKLKKARERT